MLNHDTRWDVDKYRCDHESDEHWGLRRQFMVSHKEKFPEPRLVCLTQVFFNMEFLGCKYPEKTMNLVNKLAAEVAKDFRDSRKDKLKRTFVGAQDAAGAKAKGAKPPQGTVEGSQAKGNEDSSPPLKKSRTDPEMVDLTDDPSPGMEVEVAPEYRKALEELSKTFVLMIPPRSNSKIEEDPIKILNENFPNDLTYPFTGSKAEGGWTCQVMVNRTNMIAKVFATTQRQGKEQAATIALNNLRQYCTIVEPNPDWFQDGRTPEFIQKRIPCNKTPRTYLIMTKKDTGHITAEVADLLLQNFKKSSNHEMFFLCEEYGEKEKTQLMNRTQHHNLGFRHFGTEIRLKDHHVCIYKKKTAKEIVEEAKSLGGKHPRYKITFKQSTPK